MFFLSVFHEKKPVEIPNLRRFLLQMDGIKTPTGRPMQTWIFVLCKVMIVELLIRFIYHGMFFNHGNHSLKGNMLKLVMFAGWDWSQKTALSRGPTPIVGVMTPSYPCMFGHWERPHNSIYNWFITGRGPPFTMSHGISWLKYRKCRCRMGYTWDNLNIATQTTERWFMLLWSENPETFRITKMFRISWATNQTFICKYQAQSQRRF